jgi:hypothetical protein
MKFNRYLRYSFKRTRRKDLAAERKMRLEREAMPLLAELIRENQPPLDGIMADRERRWIESEQKNRANRAKRWREARKLIAAMSPEKRKVLIEQWNRGIYPADPVYLFYLIRKLTTPSAS